MEMTALNGMVNHYALLLYQMVWERAEKKKSFLAVELGVSVGNSTVAILAGLDMAKRGHLFSYDIQECGGAEDNVATAVLGHRWQFKVSDSIAAAKFHIEESVDFLFLDTDHEYENTVKELEAWSPVISPSGRILLHDTLTSPQGVGRAVEEFLDDERNKDWSFYNIDVCCGLGVLIKP